MSALVVCYYFDSYLEVFVCLDLLPGIVICQNYLSNPDIENLIISLIFCIWYSWLIYFETLVRTESFTFATFYSKLLEVRERKSSILRKSIWKVCYEFFFPFIWIFYFILIPRLSYGIWIITYILLSYSQWTFLPWTVLNFHGFCKCMCRISEVPCKILSRVNIYHNWKYLNNGHDY